MNSRHKTTRKNLFDDTFERKISVKLSEKMHLKNGDTAQIRDAL